MNLDEYMHQGELWMDAEHGLIKIVDMQPTHRIYAARWLASHAVPLISVVEVIKGTDPAGLGSALSLIAQNPRSWIRSTELFRALTTGLSLDAGVPAA